MVHSLRLVQIPEGMQDRQVETEAISSKSDPSANVSACRGLVYIFLFQECAFRSSRPMVALTVQTRATLPYKLTAMERYASSREHGFMQAPPTHVRRASLYLRSRRDMRHLLAHFDILYATFPFTASSSVPRYFGKRLPRNPETSPIAEAAIKTKYAFE
ncbi:hypothetical protein Slin14017_G111640 [Septoria linicola]|nr:hypothetical protein Slin14017_G111640 [Septoria linicola]